ncbi:MAG: hypothetical protein ACTSXT_13300 [Candidatus Helarchaeota archaeon]
MKLTNILLTFLICLIAFQKLPLKEEKTVSKEMPTVKIGKSYQTKNVPVKVKDKKNDTKHSTTFSTYADSDGRTTERINHNIRISKKWYISTGIFARQNEWNNEHGTNLSFTYYWD